MVAHLKPVKLAKPTTHSRRRVQGRAPAWLNSEAKKLYRQYRADLASVDSWHPLFETSLATFAHLEAAFRENPSAFSAAQLSEKRRLSAELGLSPHTFARRPRIDDTLGAPDGWDEF